MKRIVLNPIWINYDITKMEALKDFPIESNIYKTIEEIIEKTKDIIRPKAILKECSVETPSINMVKIAGYSFQSRLLFDKLFHQKNVFINIVTSGDELDAVTKEYPSKIVDILKYAILNEARNEVRNYLEKHYSYKDIAELSPGSIPDWSVENNKALFDLAANVDEINVILKGDCFMLPVNSISGVLFSGDKDYINCNLCKKHACIGRKAPFNEKEYSRIFNQF